MLFKGFPHSFIPLTFSALLQEPSPANAPVALKFVFCKKNPPKHCSCTFGDSRKFLGGGRKLASGSLACKLGKEAGSEARILGGEKLEVGQGPKNTRAKRGTLGKKENKEPCQGKTAGGYNYREDSGGGRTHDEFLACAVFPR